jgi:hypothetical protein
MIETFQRMDLMLQIYWIAAIAASAVFLVQAIATFIGFDSDSDFSGGDGAFDSDGFSLISIKTVVCFILGFGWTGVLFHAQIASPFLLGLLATGVGLLFMTLIAVLLGQMMKLTRDNSFHAADAVGKVAEVYLRVPPAKSDTGKVMVSVNGSMHELEAMTLETEALPTGMRVRVVAALDGDVVLVQSLG